MYKLSVGFELFALLSHPQLQERAQPMFMFGERWGCVRGVGGCVPYLGRADVVGGAWGGEFVVLCDEHVEEFFGGHEGPVGQQKHRTVMRNY